MPTLTYQASSILLAHEGEEGGYLLEVTADIIDYDTEHNEFPLGSARFTKIQIGEAINNHASLLDLFDTSQEICDLGNTFFDFSKNFDFTPQVQNLFPEASSWDDILYIEQLGLRPAYRGQRLGLKVLLQIMRDWNAGCSLVVLQPHPLQHSNKASKEKELKLEKLPTDLEASRIKLSQYYAQLGFKPIPNTTFMALCTHDKSPTAAEV